MFTSRNLYFYVDQTWNNTHGNLGYNWCIPLIRLSTFYVNTTKFKNFCLDCQKTLFINAPDSVSPSNMSTNNCDNVSWSEVFIDAARWFGNARLSQPTTIHWAAHGKEQRGWRYKSHPDSSVKGIECPPSFRKSSGAPSLITARRTKQRSVSYKVAFSIKAKGRNPDLNSKSCVH